jgi:hypothetical protein
VTPAKAEFGMVTLRFADRSSPVEPIESLLKISETPGLLQVVSIHNNPTGQLGQQFGQFSGIQVRRPIAAGNTAFLVEGHGKGCWEGLLGIAKSWP